jgi:hypothetical protein
MQVCTLAGVIKRNLSANATDQPKYTSKLVVVINFELKRSYGDQF